MSSWLLSLTNLCCWTWSLWLRLNEQRLRTVTHDEELKVWTIIREVKLTMQLEEMTIYALNAVCPQLNKVELFGWVKEFGVVFPDHDITTPRRVAAFLGQAAYESAEFEKLTEDLEYKNPEHLYRTFPTHFTSVEEAAQFIGNPEALANHVYANRLGNGPPESGDGWLFRGRGLIQTTGRYNYARVGQIIGARTESVPEILETKWGAAKSACIYWTDHTFNELADSWAIDTITLGISGSTRTCADRLSLCAGAFQAITAQGLVA
jgi:putative chitinase